MNHCKKHLKMLILSLVVAMAAVVTLAFPYAGIHRLNKVPDSLDR